MLSRRFIAVFCAGAMLAGCGGTSVPLPGLSSLAPSASNVLRHKKDGKVRLRIRMPKKRVLDRHGRPHFVSPATQGLTVAITGPTSVNVTVALTATSDGCQSSLATAICNFTYVLAPGAYHATLVTYDAISGCPGACTIPGGANELSTAQAIAFTVTAGATNNVPLTLSGVPASILILPMSSNGALNVAHGVDLFGTGAHKMLVEALDADGNIIFGAGSPTFTVAQSNGSLNVQLVQPTAAQPNVFTITPPSAFATTTAQITATAAYTGQPTNGCTGNAVCTGTMTFDMKELIATNSFTQAFVYETGKTSPFAIIAGLNDVNNNSANENGLVFDPSGDLFLAVCNRGCNNGGQPDAVEMFAPPYTGEPVIITRDVTDPQALMVDSAGNLYVGNCGSCNVGGTDSVTIYAPPFTASSQPKTTVTSGIVDPQAMILDSTGNLFVADCLQCSLGGTDVVTEYPSPYTGMVGGACSGSQAPPCSIGAGSFSYPVQLALDSSGDLMVANSNNNVGGGSLVLLGPPRYTIGDTITNNFGSSATFNDPSALTEDVGGTSFVAGDNANSQVYVCGPPFNTSACGTGSTISTGVNGPTAVIEDAVGNLYVANNGGNSIRSYAAGAFTGAATVVTTNGNAPFSLAVLP